MELNCVGFVNSLKTGSSDGELPKPNQKDGFEENNFLSTTAANRSLLSHLEARIFIYALHLLSISFRNNPQTSRLPSSFNLRAGRYRQRSLYLMVFGYSPLLASFVVNQNH